MAWFENHQGHCGKPFLACSECFEQWQFGLRMICEFPFETRTIAV
jgi:hypothetical protein